MNGDPVPIDETLELLADRTRRRLVWRLRDAEDLPVAQLAADLADADELQTDGGTGANTRRAVEARLRHVHLPKLADAGVIDYDRRAGTVAPTDRVETACEFLDLVPDTVCRTG